MFSHDPWDNQDGLMTSAVSSPPSHCVTLKQNPATSWITNQCGSQTATADLLVPPLLCFLPKTPCMKQDSEGRPSPDCKHNRRLEGAVCWGTVCKERLPFCQSNFDRRVAAQTAQPPLQPESLYSRPQTKLSTLGWYTRPQSQRRATTAETPQVFKAQL